jgi:hypothetical protein
VPEVLRLIADLAEKPYLSPSVPIAELGDLGAFEVRTVQVPGTLAFVTYRHTFDLGQEEQPGKDYREGTVDLLSID